MARVLRGFVLLIGLVLLVAGVGAAAYVGPDDDVWLEPAEPDATAGQPVVVAPELLAWTDLTLLLRAEAEGGVFVGAAHPVDVQSLASLTDHHLLTGIRRTQVLGGDRAREASTEEEIPPLESLESTWTDQAVGAGAQELRLELDGSPTQVVVMPAGEVVPTLTFGAHVGGLFTMLLGIGALGLAVCLLALWRMGRARRRRRTAAASAASYAGQSHPGQSHPGQPHPGLPQPQSSGGGWGPPGARRGALCLAPLVLVLAGCGMVPSEVEPSASGKVAMSADDLEGVLASYDKRNNKAIMAAGAPGYDSSLWQGADVGPVLDADIASTRLAAAVGRGKGRPFRQRGIRVYAPELDSYPVWALVVSDIVHPDLKGKKLEEQQERLADDERAVKLTWLVRESVTEPWRMRLGSSAPLDELPEPADHVRARKPVLEAARRATDGVMAYLTGKKASGGLVVDRGAKEIRKGFASVDSAIIARERFEPMGADQDEDEEPRAVAVEGGHLVTTVRYLRHWLDPRPGYNLQWQDGAEAINGVSAGRLYSDRHVHVTVFVAADGSEVRVVSTGHHTSPL